MKQNFTFLFLLFLSTVFGQKTVNDSLIDKYAKKSIHENQQVLKLNDLKNIDNIFNFRFTSNEITIELFKDDNELLHLESYQYLFQVKKGKNIDTIINHIKHNNETAIWLYNNIEKGKFEKKIPAKINSSQKSGVFMEDDYYLEFSDKNNYIIKSFPYPDLDTISENYTLKNLVEDLYKKIDVENLNTDFIDKLPRGYSYTNLFHNYTLFIMSNSNVDIGYIGNYRLPIGVSFGYSVNKIKKKSFNIGTDFNIQNNFNDNFHFITSVRKRKIFGNDKTYYDSFSLIYEYNKLDYIKTFPKFENNEIIYSGTIDKYFSFGVGYNQLKTQQKLDGLSFGLRKIFESINLSPYYEIDLFENKITNYEIGIGKTVMLNKENHFSIYTRLFYEKTFDFKSLNLSLYIPIKNGQLTKQKHV